MGTRFRLFVQPPFEDSRARPETVTVSSPAGSIGPGPSDDRMYVVEPVGKHHPYGMNVGPLGTPFIFLPPWKGPRLAPALPDALGHFDHYTPDSQEFQSAHLFGAIRFTLDVWERYLGHPLTWHFTGHYDRLEICILPDWNNAQYGYGFLETGSQLEPDGRILPFSLNFDVIAHELGHAIVYAIVGVPQMGTEFPEYIGFQEAAADCVSLVSVMHFPSLMEEVLEQTHGNLYLHNRLARFSEFSTNRQMRMASNPLTMLDFVGGWHDEHELSQPLTGAVFDTLVDVFHEFLMDRGLIAKEVEQLADAAEDDPALRMSLQKKFDSAYAKGEQGFSAALVDARDVVGRYFAEALWSLSPDFMDYATFADLLLSIDRQQSAGRLSRLIERNFRRRGIGQFRAGPRLAGKHANSHICSARTILPQDRMGLRPMSYRERYLARH